MTRKTWNFQDYGDWVGYQVLRRLPISWVSGLAVLSGRLIVFYLILRGRLWFRRIGENISKLTGENDPKALRQRQTEVICNLQRVQFEFALLDRLLHSKRMRITGTEHFDRATPPIIFVGAHIGNWELQAQALVRHGVSITALYEPPESPAHLTIAMNQRRSLPGTRYIPSSPRAARELVRAIDNGENLWLAVDELKHDLIWGPPLGRKLPYAGNRMLAARLAVRAGATIIPIRSRRTDKTHFEIHFGAPLLPPSTGDARQDACALADRISETVEPWVLENLTQWYPLPVFRHNRPVVTPGSRLK